ncbi:MAG: hypothetical protein H6733_11230 [Alphaproteobacteria bacterium]|nr:hypothetical protein [Alphaproteobacteria bacterium]
MTYPTSAPLPGLDALASWLTEHGEAFDRQGPDVLELRALPLRIVHGGDGVRAQVDLTPTVPLSRLTRLLFDLSVRVGADVRLVGVGQVNRPSLWLRFADEQDRLRVAAALAKAAAQSHRDDILKAMWSVLGTLGGGRDLRWDATRERIVEMREVGSPDGISVEDARWHDAEVSPGDTVAVPVSGDLHILVWRWLADAWPSLAGT